MSLLFVNNNANEKKIIPSFTALRSEALKIITHAAEIVRPFIFLIVSDK